MRVLTCRQPWAYAITYLGKSPENRTRNVAGTYRGLVAIHAAKTATEDWFDPGGAGDQIEAITRVYPGIAQCDFGAIIGVASLVDAHRGVTEDGSEICYCSQWAQIENWHLVLDDPRPLPEPIPYRGGLGLRTLPGDIEQAIWAQLAEATR